jgi:hypothetical protein
MPDITKIATQKMANKVIGWGNKLPRYSTESKKRVKTGFFGELFLIEADELICSLLVLIPMHLNRFVINAGEGYAILKSIKNKKFYNLHINLKIKTKNKQI